MDYLEEPAEDKPRWARRFNSAFTVWYKEDMAIFGWVKQLLGVRIDSYKIFEDGILICAIANNLWEGSITREEVLYGSALQRLELSIKAMHTYLGVPPVLDTCAVVDGRGQEGLLEYLLKLKRASEELEKQQADINREETLLNMMKRNDDLTGTARIPTDSILRQPRDNDEPVTDKPSLGQIQQSPNSRYSERDNIGDEVKDADGYNFKLADVSQNEMAFTGEGERATQNINRTVPKPIKSTPFKLHENEKTLSIKVMSSAKVLPSTTDDANLTPSTNRTLPIHTDDIFPSSDNNQLPPSPEPLSRQETYVERHNFKIADVSQNVMTFTGKGERATQNINRTVAKPIKSTPFRLHEKEKILSIKVSSAKVLPNTTDDTNFTPSMASTNSTLPMHTDDVFSSDNDQLSPSPEPLRRQETYVVEKFVPRNQRPPKILKRSSLTITLSSTPPQSPLEDDTKGSKFADPNQTTPETKDQISFEKTMRASELAGNQSMLNLQDPFEKHTRDSEFAENQTTKAKMNDQLYALREEEQFSKFTENSTTPEIKDTLPFEKSREVSEFAGENTPEIKDQVPLQKDTRDSEFAAIQITPETSNQLPFGEDANGLDSAENQNTAKMEDHCPENLVTNLNDLLDDPPSTRKFPRSGFDRNVLYSPFSMPFISVRQKNRNQSQGDQQQDARTYAKQAIRPSSRKSSSSSVSQSRSAEMTTTMMARMASRAPKGTMSGLESDE